jgi:hypothetical protein
MSNTGPSDIIAVPKGDGALQGIAEKFSPDLHTGSGNFTIPIALPRGRNGVQSEAEPWVYTCFQIVRAEDLVPLGSPSTNAKKTPGGPTIEKVWQS